MVVVPVQRLATQETNRAPDTYLRVQASPEDAGAAIGRAMGTLGQGISQLGNSLSNIADKENERRNADSVTDAYYRFQDRRRQFMYGENGEMTKRGQDAFGSVARVDDFYKSSIEETTKALENERQRLAFLKMVQRDRDSTLDAVGRYETTQRTEYKDQAARGILDNSVADAVNAYNDPKIVANSIETGRRVLLSNLQGQPPEVIERELRGYESRVHSSIITRLISENPTAAENYYTANRDKINGEDHIKIANMLAEPIRRREINDSVNSIIGNNSPSSRLLNAMIFAESGGNPNLEGPERRTMVDGELRTVRAQGLMQVLPSTARYISPMIDNGALVGKSDEEVGKILRDNPALNRQYGAFYMDQQLRRFNGDIEAALVAYNAGPANADKWLQSGRDYSALPRPDETRKYVEKIRARYGDISGSKQVGGDPTPAATVRMGELPPPGQRMTRENWDLSFYRPQDMMAPSGGAQWVDARAAKMVDELGRRFHEATGIRVPINEDHDFTGPTSGRRRGTRDPNDNPGASGSQHLYGRAFDFQIQSLDEQKKALFIRMAREIGFTGIGFYEGGPGHLHLDIGAARSWGRVPSWASEAMNISVPTPEQRTATRQALGLPPEPPPTRRIPQSTAASTTPMSMPTQPVFPPTVQQPESVILTPGFSVPRSQDRIDVEEANLDDWLDSARADPRISSDPRILAAVEAKLTSEFNRRQRAVKETRNSVLRSAWEHVAKGGSIDNMPPELLSDLQMNMPDKIKSIEEYQDRRERREEPKTNYTTYYRLSRMSNEELNDENLWEYRNQLSNEHFERFAAMQRTARETIQNGANRGSDVISVKDMANLAMVSAGIDPKDAAGAKLAGQFMLRLDSFVSSFKRDNKTMPETKRIQEEIDRLLTVTNSSDWFGRKKFVFEEGTPEEIEVRRQEMGSRATQGIDSMTVISDLEQIPPLRLRELSLAFREKNGRPITPEQSVRIYNNLVKIESGALAIPQTSDAMERQFIQALTTQFRNSRQRDPTPDELANNYSRFLARTYLERVMEVGR